MPPSSRIIAIASAARLSAGRNRRYQAIIVASASRYSMPDSAIDGRLAATTASVGRRIVTNGLNG